MSNGQEWVSPLLPTGDQSDRLSVWLRLCSGHLKFRPVGSEGLVMFSRSSSSPRLGPRSYIHCKPAKTDNYMHTTLQHVHTHIQFIYQTERQAHPLFPTSAGRAPLQLRRLWQNCFSVQYVWEKRGLGGVGDLEVGQGFQKTSTVPSQELLSRLGSLPLNGCHLHPSCKILLGSSWGGIWVLWGSVPSQERGRWWELEVAAKY